MLLLRKLRYVSCVFLLAHTPSISLAQHVAKDSGITFNDFTRPTLLTKLLRHNSLKHFIDTIERSAPPRSERLTRIYPVTFYGEPAIMELVLRGDTVIRADIYPGYISRSARPSVPYGTRRSVHSTMETFEALKRRIASSDGDPSVMGETFFLYLGGNGSPTMNAQFKNDEILVSLTP